MTSKPAIELTAAQRKVLGLVVKGYSNPQIAMVCHVSTHTVKRHVADLIAVVRVQNRVQLAVWAVREKMALSVSIHKDKNDVP